MGFMVSPSLAFQRPCIPGLGITDLDGNSWKVLLDRLSLEVLGFLNPILHFVQCEKNEDEVIS